MSAIPTISATQGSPCRREQAAGGDAAAERSEAPSSELADAGNQPAGEPVLPSGPSGENYLLVGTDSTLGLAADDPLRSGHHDYSRLADVIMVIRLRDDGTAAMLSIPRDFAAEIAGTSDIAGTGVVAKINSAYNRDSTAAARAARLINTVEENLDITLQHFVEADFQAFLRLVDAVGGVWMTFEQPLRDQPKENATDPAQSRSGLRDRGRHPSAGRAAGAGVRPQPSPSKRSCPTAHGSGSVHGTTWPATTASESSCALPPIRSGLHCWTTPSTCSGCSTLPPIIWPRPDTLSLVSDGRRLAGQFVGIDVDADVEEYELRVVDVHDPVPWSLGLNPDRAEHNQRVLDVFRGIGWDDVVESRVRVQVTGPQRQRLAAELSALGFIAEAAGELPDGVDRPPDGSVVYLSPRGRLAAGLLASRLVPVPDFAGHADLDESTVILHTGDQPPRVDAGYRRVDVPTSDQLLP